MEQSCGIGNRSASQIPTIVGEKKNLRKHSDEFPKRDTQRLTVLPTHPPDEPISKQKDTAPIKRVTKNPNQIRNKKYQERLKSKQGPRTPGSRGKTPNGTSGRKYTVGCSIGAKLRGSGPRTPDSERWDKRRVRGTAALALSPDRLFRFRAARRGISKPR